MKKLMALLLALVMVLGMVACGAKEETAAPEANNDAANVKENETAAEVESEVKYKDTLILALGELSSTNPLTTDNAVTAALFNSTHSRLVEYDFSTAGAVKPGLAESWEWTADNVIEFKLREGVQFHNGETLAADDVVFTFEAIQAGANASKIPVIDSVEAVDDLTVRFTLPAYNADFTSLMAAAVASILNREACEADIDNGPTIGTGAYMVTDFVPADYVLIERFDGYFGEAPKTRCMKIVNIPEMSTALVALQNGEIDFCEFSANDQMYVEEDTNLEYIVYPSNTVYFLAFNTSKGVTADENLRLAVAHAIDLESILALHGDGVEAATVQWGPSTYGYDDSIGLYDRDLDLAKEYLAKAFPNGGAELTISVRDTLAADTATIIQANCAEIGLTVNIEEVEGSALTAMSKFSVAEHQSMIYTTGWNLYGDDCRRVYYPNSNTNKAVITDERMIELIDAAVSEKDDAARQEMYHEIQQINKDKCYVLPLCINVWRDAYTKGMTGIEFASNARNNYTYAHIVEE